MSSIAYPYNIGNFYAKLQKIFIYIVFSYIYLTFFNKKQLSCNYSANIHSPSFLLSTMK